MTDREMSGFEQQVEFPAKYLSMQNQGVIFNRPQVELKAYEKSGFSLKTEHLNHVLSTPHWSC